MTNYRITVTSDIVCPWCYVGHVRLLRAIEDHQQKFPEDTFKITYLPYYLTKPSQNVPDSVPPFPVMSRPRREHYDMKFGPGAAKHVERKMSAIFEGEGLKLNFDGRTGPSKNGHRLVYYAQTHGGEDVQNAVLLGLWKRYYEQGVDITTLEILTEVGVEAGLPEAEVKRYLESGEGGEEVDRLAAESRSNGVTGVPHYVVQDMWAVSGAQEPASFELMFRRYKQYETKPKSGSFTLPKIDNSIVHEVTAYV